jgi:hypothetical protein
MKKIVDEDLLYTKSKIMDNPIYEVLEKMNKDMYSRKCNKSDVFIHRAYKAIYNNREEELSKKILEELLRALCNSYDTQQEMLLDYHRRYPLPIVKLGRE